MFLRHMREGGSFVWHWKTIFLWVFFFLRKVKTCLWCSCRTLPKLLFCQKWWDFDLAKEVHIWTKIFILIFVNSRTQISVGEILQDHGRCFAFPKYNRNIRKRYITTKEWYMPNMKNVLKFIPLNLVSRNTRCIKVTKWRYYFYLYFLRMTQGIISLVFCVM